MSQFITRWQTGHRFPRPLKFCPRLVFLIGKTPPKPPTHKPQNKPTPASYSSSPSNLQASSKLKTLSFWLGCVQWSPSTTCQVHPRFKSIPYLPRLSFDSCVIFLQSRPIGLIVIFYSPSTRIRPVMLVAENPFPRFGRFLKICPYPRGKPLS